MQQIVADPKTAQAAHELMSMFGEEAACEAAIRADTSRDKGNALGFCHWRQVERLILVLGTQHVHGSVH